MLDVQRRRRGEEVEEGGKRRKEKGQIDTEVKKHRGRKRQQNQVEKLDRTFFFSFFSFLSLFGVGNGLTLNDACQAEWKATAVAMFRRFGTSRLAQEVKYSSIWGAFLPKLCGRQYNRDYESLDLERASIKEEKSTICRQLLTIWEHYRIIPLE